jgi:hypothetical protein
MKAIHDAGYTVSLPNQLYQAMEILYPKTYYDYLDDTRGEQFSIMKHGFKGVFFVMTAINRPNYLQQKKLADAGQ